jgi:ArsR family transcriptional regulator, arsenate/arsenite/antimonite-responsive transcriptional repressor
MEPLFKALADRTRLRIINLIGESEICVCFFVEVLQVKQSRISRHLAYLRNAGLVKARRDGKWMHYRISDPSDPDTAHVFGEVRARLGRDSQMQRDRERLLHFCRSPQPPVQLQSAPRPITLSL